jgi:hypothetical protein
MRIAATHIKLISTAINMRKPVSPFASDISELAALIANKVILDESVNNNNRIQSIHKTICEICYLSYSTIVGTSS